MLNSLVLPLALLIATAGSAWSAERWQEAADGAVAILPAPIKSEGIIGGSLVCAGQQWSFRFRTEPASVLRGAHGPARLTVGKQSFSGEIIEQEGALDLAVPRDILEPLKQASALVLEAGEKSSIASASFSLNGSRVAIETITPRCSPIDMKPYQSIVLGSDSDAANEVRLLLTDEAKLFREATEREPNITAAKLQADGGRLLLFASICGSTRYYGESGCNLTGYVSQGDDWKEVYNSEGMHLYSDPRHMNGGMPNLVTVELVDGMEAMHWIWNGEAYELGEQMVDADHDRDRDKVLQ
ncbi:hypothetical protein [Foliimonas ilicis]|uniref:hypothetical protein n=1 Tax=Mesorhizobium sp. SB112 TaxID=3151853 RepID=UPI0032672C92